MYYTIRCTTFFWRFVMDIIKFGELSLFDDGFAWCNYAICDDDVVDKIKDKLIFNITTSILKYKNSVIGLEKSSKIRAFDLDTINVYNGIIEEKGALIKSIESANTIYDLKIIDGLSFELIEAV